MTTVGAPPGAELSELHDEYELLGELGRGGSAIVYRARDRSLGREVAVKVVHARHAAAGDDPVARLAREARTVAQLQHPNIVAVYAVRRVAGGLALVMPLVPGRTLKQVVLRDGPLPADRCERVLRDVASALAYAHGRNIIHRDVKPENVFLDEDTGRALLADFGIARSDEHESVTHTGTAIGTPYYMSPEQIDNAPLDGRSDLYSLGLVAWETLTGRRPWDGESLYNVIYKQKHDELPPIEALRPGVPPRLQYVVERMTHKQPAGRWAGADAVLAQLSHPVVPRDYARWHAGLKKRVDRYRREAQPAPSASAGGGFAALTTRFLRAGDRADAQRPPSLGDTLSIAVPAGSTAPSVPGADAAAIGPAPGARVAGPLARGRGAHAPARAMRARRSAVLLGGLVAITGAVYVVALGGSPAARPGDGTRAPTAAPRPATAARGAMRTADPTPAAVPSAAGPRTAPPSISSGAMIAAGGRHTCTVVPGATVHCWGANDRGQLGTGAYSALTEATPVAGDLVFVQVSAGASHSCAATRLGDVYCWGANARGQLGDATTVGRNAPVRVAGPGSYALVRAGASHTCAVRTDNTVACWGANDRGQLGDGTRTPRTWPTQIIAPRGVTFATVAAGVGHSCALGTDGTAYCWGANDGGQLGDGTREDRTTPAPVAGGLRFVAIAAGEAHGCGVTDVGDVQCWGSNAHGQLGTGWTSDALTPVRTPLRNRAGALTAGLLHSCAITTASEVFCWGRNRSGQLGDGSVVDRRSPVRVDVAEPVVEMNAVAAHTCALSVSGAIYCWGANAAGQLGGVPSRSRAGPAAVRLDADRGRGPPGDVRPAAD